jgi:hypothetical protein
MKNKFILEIYDDENNLITTTVYKSYRAIGLKTGIAYHNCRTIHSICMGDVKLKYLHKTLKRLLKRVKIKDIQTVTLI